VKEDGHLQIRALGVAPYEIRSVEKRK